MGMIDDRILHEHLHAVAHQLLVIIPEDRVVVHGHTGVLGIIDQRVADSLNISPIGTHLPIGMNLPVNGIGFDIEGNNLEGIGMHEERITL